MMELQNVTDINEVIKYAERRAEGCHQMASAYHTDEGVYLQEETRFQYKAILWENIHEWLEELKELRQKIPHGKWIDESKDALKCSVCGKWVYKPFIGGFPTERTQHYAPNYCAFCGASMVSSNSKTEKSRSKICPCIECCKLDNSEPCRKGCSDYQKWKEGEKEC